MRKVSFSDWVLICQALPFLICSRILVLLVPFRRLAPVLGTLNCVTPLERGDMSDCTKDKRLGSILKALSDYLPWRSMCLEQALAGMMLLRFKGVASTIYFGVSQGDKTLEAHAWLRCGEQIVTGEMGHKKFTTVFTVASTTSNPTGLKPFERKISSSEKSQTFTKNAKN